MAAILAMAGKRVLVIDGDIRKRTLIESFGHTFGLTTYLSDDHTQVADLIRTDAVVKGVDFLPSGPTPPNPTELLMSDRLHQLMQQLRRCQHRQPRVRHHRLCVACRSAKSRFPARL